MYIIVTKTNLENKVKLEKEIFKRIELIIVEKLLNRLLKDNQFGLKEYR